MSKKISITIVVVIVLISLAISIYIPNRDKLKTEKEDVTINYSTIEKDGKVGVAENGETVIEPQYDNIIIPNEHRAVFMCKNGEDNKFVDAKNKEIFTNYDNVELIEYDESKYERNILRYEKNGKYGLLGIAGNTVTCAKYEDLTTFAQK